MRRFLAVTRESFLCLRRDRIFAPALAAGFVLFIVSNLASEFGVEEFRRILYDVGAASFQGLTGIVAVLWGTRLVHDARGVNGSLEVQMASPLSRSTWILGKFAGLGLALALLGAMLVAVWQVLLLVNGFDLMEPRHLWIFALFVLQSLIVGAAAILCATFSAGSVAIFLAIAAWLLGLTVGEAAAILPGQLQSPLFAALRGAARYWDLQRLNLAAYATRDGFPEVGELLARAGFGVALIVVLVATTILVFDRQDLVA